MRKILKKVIFLTAILLILQSGTVSAIAAQAQPAVPVLKGTVKGDTVTLQWNKAKGFSGCQIFLYYKLYKKYRSLGNYPAGKNLLILKGSQNKVYKYKIRSYTKKNGKVIYSKMSKVLTIKTAPSSPAVSQVKRSSDTEALITWSRISLADGYQIFRADSEQGKYIRVGVASGNRVLSFRDNTLNEEQDYYYRVRAYCRNPDAVVYSGYSEPVKACRPAPKPVIILGDSRTEELREFTGDNKVAWICKGSMGYVWLRDTAVKAVDEQIQGNEDLFFWLGVNDLDNIDNYISLLNEKIPQWKQKGVRVHILAVGPVEIPDEYADNKTIKAFNKKMKAQIAGADFIDLYSWLTTQGYKTADGTHYDRETCMKIYNYIMSQVQ